MILPLRICKPWDSLRSAKYKWPLVLIASYQLLCLISLILNADRFTNIGDLLRWGLTFIAGQMLLPICVFIFLLPQPNVDLADKNLIQHELPANDLCNNFNANFTNICGRSCPFYSVLRLHGHWHNNSSPTNGLPSTDLGAIMGIILFLIIWSYAF